MIRKIGHSDKVFSDALTRLRKDGMQGGNDRHIKIFQQVVNMRSIRSTEDPELVLETNQAQPGRIQVIRRQAVVFELMLSNFKYNFTRIVVRVSFVRYCDHA